MEEPKKTFKAHIIPRSGTSAIWELVNPVLLKGEMGVESDTGRFKFGDGTTPWHDLAYSGERGEIGNLEIGGRNLLLGTAESEVTMGYPFKSYPISEQIENGKDVTLTFWGKLDDSVEYLMPYNSGGMLGLLEKEEGMLLAKQIKNTGRGSITFKWRLDYNLFHYTKANGAVNSTKVGDYAFRQTQADDRPDLYWKVQGVTADSRYISLADQPTYNSTGRHSINITIPFNEDFEYFRFGLNGTTIDTLCSFSGLTPGNYTLSFDLDNNIQGEVQFSHIKIVSGHNGDTEWRASLLDTGNAPTNDRLDLYAMGADFSANYSAKTITHIKLEYGNVATDWSPAPEDKANAALDNVTADSAHWNNGTYGYSNLFNGLLFQWNRKGLFRNGLTTQTIYLPWGYETLYAGAFIVETGETSPIRARISKVSGSSVQVVVERLDGGALTSDTTVGVFAIQINPNFDS